MDDVFTAPMRRDLTKHGVRELRTPEDVDNAVSAGGTLAIAVNSACGCSAGRMRPAFIEAMQGEHVPDAVATVFAGQDKDATTRAREYFTDRVPSSPSVALLKDGKLVYMLERKDIERRLPTEIAADLKRAFEFYCNDSGE